ncbi:MAG: hypothetical protein GC150_15355 [Rhizobiales bacterium]|nr:hypothetical protein [Hyphomicrobiales bacterium]
MPANSPTSVSPAMGGRYIDDGSTDAPKFVERTVPHADGSRARDAKGKALFKGVVETPPATPADPDKPGVPIEADAPAKPGRRAKEG